jgi:cyclase
MLSKRIIPCLDVDNGLVMKGVKFEELEKIGKPPLLAKIYYRQGADELVFLDIGASYQNRKTLFAVIKQISKEIFIPLTVGGGIRCLEDVQQALSNGADKVSINTAGVINPDLIKESSKKFGKQCIVCAIDAIKTKESWEVLINGGRRRTGIDAIKWAKQAEKLGVGEILLTSWDADGTKKGYDLELTKTVAENVNIPIIASGGAGSLEDILKVLTIGKADAALVARLFHNKTYTIEQVKYFLKQNGVEIR